MAHWSQWFNLDDPGNGDGDFETLERIQEYQNVCPVTYHVTGAQCQFVSSNTTFDSSSAAQSAVDVLIQPCTLYGLICLNSMQPSNECHDYRVRFMCQENEVSENSGRRGPQLLVDSRIYLTFLAVPLIICFIRVFWVFVYKKYCRQPQRRNINRRSVSTSSDASESSEASDDDSMTSSLAHPPPSYADLFGVSHARVFAISRGSLVRQCSKCQHYTDFGANSAIFSTGSSRADELEIAMTSGNDCSSAGGTRLPASDIASGEAIIYSGDPSADFDQGGINGFNPQLADRADQEHPGWAHTAAQSGASVAPHPLPQLVATDTCPCACHSGGHDNLAFVCNSPADVAGGLAHPGMHVPLFSRVDSDTSFRSVTDSLPDYDQALEILKKSHDLGRSEDSCV